MKFIWRSESGWRSAFAAVAVVVATVGPTVPPAGALVPPPDPTFVNRWGTNGAGNGQFSQPSAVAIGPDGTVYVADTGNSRIQRFDPVSGTYLGAFGAGGPAPSTLWFPYGVDVDEAGDVWVVDSANRRIKQFTSTGTWKRTFGASGTGNGQFNFPYGIEVANGHVWVADSLNDRVQEFLTDGTWQRTFGSAGTGDGQFSDPGDVAVDRHGDVYVADTYNNRVQVFNAQGVFLRKFGSSGSGPGQLSRAQSIDVDGAGRVYVASAVNARIDIFGPRGAVLGSFGGLGTGDGQFNAPYGVAVERGRIAVVDGSLHRAQQFDPCGPTFPDMTAANSFFDAVCWGTAASLVNGYADGTFRGTTAVSRQAVAAYLYRLSDSPAGPFPPAGFPDVTASNPFALEIDWLVSAGIATGYPDGTFRPTAPVSRQAIAAYLHAMESSPIGPFVDPGFFDVPPSHAFATPIWWLAYTKITSGYADGGFHPTAPVSRQAMVQFLAEFDALFLH